MQRVHWLLVVVMVICCVSDSLAASKDREFIPKKKNRDPAKIRSDLATNETAVIPPSEGETVVDKTKEEEKDKDAEGEKEIPVVQDEVIVENQSDKEKPPAPVLTVDDDKFDGGEAKPKPPTSTSLFSTRVKNIIRKMMQLLGLQGQKRKSRMLDNGDSDNSLMMENSPYTDEVRATVGAILGRRECLKKAACGAGAYLRNVKGKEVLIVLLEKLTPNSWAESVSMVKEAAIYKDPCHYECE